MAAHKKKTNRRRTQLPSNHTSPRVLVMAHGHPAYTTGGAEIAAYELYTQLRAQHEAWYLGCYRDPQNSKNGVAISQPDNEREYLYRPAAFDWFKFANQDPRFPDAFRALLKTLKPTVVHLHHYLEFGVEAILQIRNALPDCRIVLTLHEYLAICHHYGQMVTTKHYTLCHEASGARCNRCFPEFSEQDFFLRKKYIEGFFELVDLFVAPSHFLAERYRVWGVPPAKLTVIENVTTQAALSEESALPAERSANDGPLRVGFFGQISVLNGIIVFLEAAALFSERKDYSVSFAIYGDYVGQPPDFQKEFLERLSAAGRNVRFRGPYDRQRVDLLMSEVDVVVVPSIWWENSPLVIQEALRNNRWILCSDIGGLKEKVTDGVTGAHFPVGDVISLSLMLADLARSRRSVRVRDFSLDDDQKDALQSAFSAHLALYAQP